MCMHASAVDDDTVGASNLIAGKFKLAQKPFLWCFKCCTSYNDVLHDKNWTFSTQVVDLCRFVQKLIFLTVPVFIFFTVPVHVLFFQHLYGLISTSWFCLSMKKCIAAMFSCF